MSGPAIGFAFPGARGSAAPLVDAFATGGQVLPNPSTNVTLSGWTEVTDADGAFDAAAGVYTAPRAGYYLFTVRAHADAVAMQIDSGRLVHNKLFGHYDITLDGPGADAVAVSVTGGGVTIQIVGGGAGDPVASAGIGGAVVVTIEDGGATSTATAIAAALNAFSSASLTPNGAVGTGAGLWGLVDHQTVAAVFTSTATVLAFEKSHNGYVQLTQLVHLSVGDTVEFDGSAMTGTTVDNTVGANAFAVLGLL